MRIDLGSDAWLEHDPAWIEPGEASALQERLKGELDWQQREIVLFGRRILQPRLIAWAGALGYRYSGQTLPPRPFTPTLEQLRARVCGRVSTPFNHILVNRYRTGADSMGFHADDEPELGPDPVVATVSLGATRRFLLRPRRRRGGRGYDLELGAGSLLVMGGTCQRYFLHGVPRQADARDERISLTFRWLLRPPPPD